MKNMINQSELKEIQLELLRVFDKYCMDNNLQYFLFAGSLIGAVRHGGYIPWDDDIDIIMFREDYEVLIKKFNNDNSKSCFKLVDIENADNYYLPYGKLINTNTVLVEECQSRIELGVNLDIFVADNVGNDFKKAWKQYIRVDLLKKAILFKQVKYSENRNLIKNIVLNIGKTILKPLSLKSLILEIRKLCKYRMSCNRDKYVCNLSGAIYGKGEIHERSCYTPSKRVKFETIEANIPGGYDRILTGLYGDYMKLPPEEKRISHHSFEAWWKTE